jgi:hypothetical protein
MGMSDSDITLIRRAMTSLKSLLYWHSEGDAQDPGMQSDAAIEARIKIAALVESKAIENLNHAALVRRKAQSVQKTQE